MKIVSLNGDVYLIPLPTPLSDSTHGTITHFEIVIARIKCDDGSEGVGYTYTVGAGGLAVKALINSYIAPLLRDREADRIEALWQTMWWGLHYGGRGGPTSLAISAVDIALWDAKTRNLRVPLWRLLGGYDQKVPAYAGGVDLDLPLEALLKQTDENIAKGFRAIKMKVGRKHLSEDIDRVHAMRKHLGPDFPLMADANMRWSVDEAIRASRALSEFRLIWLEEPTIPDDFLGHARIMRDGALPIATGENLHSPYEFKELIEGGGVSFPEPDVTNCGGITAFLKIAHLAETFNLPVTSHGAHDLTVHLLAALPNRSYLEVHGFGLDRFIKMPMTITDGFALAPERPGHGIEFDWESLARFRRPD